MRIISFTRLSMLFFISFTISICAAERDLSAILDQAVTLPFVSERAGEQGLQTNLGKLNYTKKRTQDRSRDLKKLKSSLNDYIQALQKSSASKLAKDSMLDVLSRVAKKDAGRATDEVNPAFARRLLHNGWLQSLPVYKELKKETGALLLDLDKAMRLTSLQQWKRASKKLRLLGNAWGGRVWVLSGTGKTGELVAMHPAVPMYDQSISVNKVWVQSELAKGVSVLDADAMRHVVVIEVYATGKKLLRWDVKDGFSANKTLWRKIFSNRSPSLIEDYFPPHVVQQGVHGEIYALIVGKGILYAVKDSTAASAEKFLTQAAQVMPNGAYVDLIGQYMMKYVYDSPETTTPYLVGSRDVNGDIHQTAVETLSTVTAGVCRGDCDDLSELYHNIIQRQDKLGHVVMLPGHAALAFAELKKDMWSVYVLQTGPALEFTDEKLPLALGKAYKHFGANETFDPNGMGLLLRFSNEKTRGTWRLGWRIFSDKEYAETMIDIQKDWHYQTYLQAIQKMEKMLEDDANKDPANYRELSSLFSFTGQYKKFAIFHEKAVALTKDPVSLLEFKKDYIMSLFETELKSEAIQAVNELLQQLKDPEIRKALDFGVVNFGMQIAGVCAGNQEPQLALQVLKQTIDPLMQRFAGMLGQAMQRGAYKKAEWNMNQQLLMLRGIVRQYAAVSLTARKQLTAEQRAVPSMSAAMADFWIKKIAFADVRGPDGVLAHYSVIALRMSMDTERNALLAELESVEMPKTFAGADHQKILESGERATQLSWIKASSAYWAGQILSHASDKTEKLDIGYIKKCDQALNKAIEFSEQAGITSRSAQIMIIQAQVAAAMLRNDSKRLAGLLQTVKQREDKWLRDGVAALMGNLAVRIDLKDYKKLIEVWIAQINYKPKHYWIAWRAALSGAPKHALWVAKRGAELFKDDASFVEEYNYMKKLLR